MFNLNDAENIKQYIKEALSVRDNVLVQYAVGYNSTYGGVLHRLIISSSVITKGLEGYEIWLDNDNIVVEKNTWSNNGSGTLTIAESSTYCWIDSEAPSPQNFDPSGGENSLYNVTPLSTLFDELYNMLIERAEDVTGLSIEEFTDSHLSYRTNKNLKRHYE